MSWLDTLLFGYREIQSGGTALAARGTVNFIGATITDNAAQGRTDVDLTSITLGSGGGDVTGPLATNVVTKLTGVLGVVNTPNAAWKLTSLLAGIGDMITASGTALTFGNGIVNPSVTLSGGTTTVRSNGSYVNILSSGANPIYYDADVHRFRSVAGTEWFQFSTAAFLLDSGSGIFPATGLLRVKSYVTPTDLIGWRHAGGDSFILRTDGATQRLTIGDSAVTTGTDLIIQAYYGLTLQVQGAAMLFYAAGDGFAFSHWSGADNLTIPVATAGGAANMLFGQDVIGTLGQKQRTGDNAARTLNITGQAASATASAGPNEHGGAVRISGGDPDGAGAYGPTRVGSPLDPGYLIKTPAATPVNLTAAESRANFMLFDGAFGGAFTVNVVRPIADTTALFVRNTTAQVATIAYLTGGTVAVAAGAAAVIISNGTNLTVHHVTT